MEIETESSKSRVFSQTQNIPWQLGWVDMSPWSGQSVTVTFVADSGAGETPIKLMLDDVSLGPWYTPLPRTASLSHLDFGVGGTIVITGENFLQSPTLFLGDTKLPDTKWINSNTIQATIPLDTPAGIYNLKVINPGGQVSYLPTTIAIGKQSYLPLIAR